VIQRREPLCFALEAREPVGIVREGFWKDLKRVDDLAGPDPCAGDQSHVL
jgi:hypothetical protein